MSQLKSRAWIITGGLLFTLLIWCLLAVHNSAVAASRESKAQNSKGACPFGNGDKIAAKTSKTEETESVAARDGKKATGSSSCCQKKKKEKEAKFRARFNEMGYTKEQIDEVFRSFSLEELEKCPHFQKRD